MFLRHLTPLSIHDQNFIEHPIQIAYIWPETLNLLPIVFCGYAVSSLLNFIPDCFYLLEKAESTGRPMYFGIFSLENM